MQKARVGAEEIRVKRGGTVAAMVAGWLEAA